MATRSLIQLRGFIEEVLGGSRSIRPADIQNNTPPESAESRILLQGGDNTVTVPDDAIGAIIIFDDASAVAKTLKGDGNDTGISLTPNSWNVLTIPDSQNTFIINANLNEEVEYLTILWF